LPQFVRDQQALFSKEAALFLPSDTRENVIHSRETGCAPVRSQRIREDNMKHALMSATGLAFLLISPEPLAAQDLASSIVGTWKLTSFVRKEVATGKSATTYGEHPSGYAYYTKGGHFLIFAVAQDRKRNEKIAAPTDAERIELFKSMFAWGGTYKTEGSKVIFDVDIAWVQSWVGTTRTYQVEVASNKLTVTTPPFKSTLDGQDIVVITTYERAE
jgi:Lipocalin-like domain